MSGDIIRPPGELGDLLVCYLERLEIDHVFGIPGGAIEPLYDALARSERCHKIKVITARHEAGAAFMADGYARETGKIGVCCTTTGPGATNLITGVASAYVDNIPLLVITAQTTLSNFGRGAFQESSYDAVNTVGMFESCTVYNSLVTHPGQFEVKLTSALMSALREPRGPAHISVPSDIFRMSAPAFPTYPDFETLVRKPPALVDFDALEVLCRHLQNSKRIALLLGRRCCGAHEIVLEFAELLGAPFVTTPQGKTCVTPYHDLNYGVFGFAGHRSAQQLLAEPELDLIISIGSNLGEWATNGWDSSSIMNNKLVVIDSFQQSFQRAPMARLHVCGDIGTILEVLSARIKVTQQSGRAYLSDTPPQEESVQEIFIPDRRESEKYRCAPRHITIDSPEKYRYAENKTGLIKPQRLICELNQRFPPETRFLADTGNSFSWTTHYLFRGNLGAYRLAMGFAAMGWAIGAGVGTAFGAPERPVVVITGDGSFLMNGQEITVAVEHNLPVIYVILNDRALGMVMHGQRLTGAERIAYQLPAVDFAAMARAMGARGYNVYELTDFDKIDYKDLCTCGQPSLIDVHIDPNEVPPMSLRARTLKSV